MKAKELMLGDFITLADSLKNDKEPLIFKVVGLGYDGEDTALVLLNGEKACDIVEIDKDWSGIPLTPEILEKNGFFMDERDGVAVRYSFATDLHKPKQTVIQFAYYDGGISADTLFKCWTSPKDCDGINDLHICDLKFVHELQHALRICGIDKEIEL